jgi:hypothetical protein
MPLFGFTGYDSDGALTEPTALSFEMSPLPDEVTYRSDRVQVFDYDQRADDIHKLYVECKMDFKAETFQMTYTEDTPEGYVTSAIDDPLDKVGSWDGTSNRLTLKFTFPHEEAMEEVLSWFIPKIPGGLTEFFR